MMKRKLRVAVAGFQHETNTFAPLPATWDEFVTPGGWPGLSTGGALVEAVKGANLPAAGAIDALAEEGHEVVPLSWASASPSAQVTRDAYDRYWAVFTEELRKAGSLDALYLDLHGAMVAEHLDDGEGEFLARVRELVGRGLPIVASLDLHANVSRAMVDNADALVSYRTYPHVDMAETGGRAARLLAEIARSGRRPAKAFRQLPYLVPLSWQSSFIAPADAIYADVKAAEGGPGAPVSALSLNMGFPLADIADCGPSVLAYGATAQDAAAAADAIERLMLEKESAFAGRLYAPDEAVIEAMRIAASAARPVVLADTQDNSGGGAPSDSVGLLEALVRHRAPGAVVGLLFDPESAAEAHRAGEGAQVRLRLGGKRVPGHRPLEAVYKVRRLGDGNFTATGPFYGGSRMKLGPMALLELDGVGVVVSSRKLQAADQEIFRHVGVEPARQRILGLKSSVHYRADFQPIAEAILVVEAPGVVHADPAKLTWKKLRPGVRLRPRAG
jgi:microcystin degradation protein MlrC